ncbi:stalk domain-containing protein [Paenibacillus sp. FSL R10-2736]
MKRMSVLFTAFCLLAVLLSPLQSRAAAAAPAKLAVYVDKENHSFIPLRFLNGFAGIQSVVSSAGGQIQVTRDDLSVTFTPGTAGASVNGKPVTLGERPFSENGMTYIPLSLVSQTLGIQLQWNKDSASLKLTSGEATATLPVQNGALIKSGTPA